MKLNPRILAALNAVAKAQEVGDAIGFDFSDGAANTPENVRTMAPWQTATAATLRACSADEMRHLVDVALPALMVAW